MTLLPRPLDPVRSIKLKISILLLASGEAGLTYLWFEFRWQPPLVTSVVTVAIVLLTAQLLAHGMTRPVREMIVASRAMAQGDYTRRIRATARDEVGELAGAFNRMAAELDAADRQRRELIANVSHELRTPIAALQAVLENVVDGSRSPTRRHCTPRSPRPSASAGWSPNCWTSHASTPGCCRSRRRRSAWPACSTTPPPRPGSPPG